MSVQRVQLARSDRHRDPHAARCRGLHPDLRNLARSDRRSRQQASARVVAVDPQLGGQLLDRVEPALAAEPVDERDPPRPRRTGRRSKSRQCTSSSDRRARRRRTWAGGRRRSPTGSHSPRRRGAAARRRCRRPGMSMRWPDGHVGGREADRPASLVAVDHRARASRGDGPSIALASASRPSTSARRIAVDDTVRSSRASAPVEPDQVVARSPRSRARAPISSSSATLPCRRWPKWKSSPTTTSRARRQSTSTSRTKSLGRLVGPVLVEADDHGVVDPGRRPAARASGRGR